jgi:hypothetical protein
LLTGRTPFKAATFGKLLAMIERDPPPRPSELNPAVDEALDAVVLTCLAKDPAARFPSAAALADALDEHAAGNRSGLVSRHAAALAAPADQVTAAFHPSRPRRRIGALVAVGLGLLFAGLAAAGVIYVQTDNGELVVELNDPNANVEVRVNGQEVVLDPAGKNVRVRAGANQKLVVTGPDFETVSETFDLKRNGKSVVHVTLKPKAVAAGPTPKPPDPIPPPPPVEPPKPVPYPTAPVVATAGGWEVLADASRADLDKWLADRKAAGHSVMWLDAVQIGEKPVFSAVAALDGRTAGWVAMPDEPGEDTEPLTKKIDTYANRLISLSGYSQDNDHRSALLWHPGFRRSAIGVGLDSEIARRSLLAQQKNHFAVRALRAYPYGPNAVRVSAYTESALEEAPFGLGLTPDALTAFLAEQRKAGNRPTSVSACPSGDGLLWAATTIPNRDKAEWEVVRNLPAGALKGKAAELAGRGFRPASVTAYPWDGAVRYTGVWVKDPPRPVPYPKAPIAVRAGGWEVLADADLPAVQTWLDDRRKAGHSVIWLDAFDVGGKPAFAAVAAADGRQPWEVVLDAELHAAPVFDPTRTGIDVKKMAATSLAPYPAGDRPRVAALFHPDATGWRWQRAVTEADVARQVADLAKDDFRLRLLRAYPAGEGSYRYVLVTRTSDRGDVVYAPRVPAADLAGYLDRGRAKGLRPVNLAPSPQPDGVFYSVVLRPDPTEWAVATDLTAATLRWKAAELAGRGFVPDKVAGYGWDGAVRYAGVWVKEAKK